MTDHGPFYRIEGRDAPGRVVLVCEHASNRFPPPWDGGLGLTDDQRRAHIAWDPGALGLARGLAQALEAPLIHATASRLIYDLNRPHAPGAMPACSGFMTFPAMPTLSPAERLARTGRALPALSRGTVRLWSTAIGAQRPVLVTVHSFTPVYFGQPRAVEFGVIHDADDRLARAIARQDRLLTRLNEPTAPPTAWRICWRGTPRPWACRHAMLEIRNDLIAARGRGRRHGRPPCPAIRAAIERGVG